MNRVLSSQPQALAILRDKLEACYQAEVEVDGLDTSQLRREGAELCTALMKAKSSQQPQPDVEREEKVSLQGWSLLETQDTDSVHSSEMTDRFDPNNISVRRTQVYPVVWFDSSRKSLFTVFSGKIRWSHGAYLHPQEWMGIENLQGNSSIDWQPVQRGGGVTSGGSRAWVKLGSGFSVAYPFLPFTILSFFFLFSDLLLSYWYCFDGETRWRNVLEETKEFCIALN